MAAACNIGKKGARSRFLGGVALLLVVGVALYVEPLRSEQPLWRLALVVPLFVAFLSLLQAREAT